MPVYYDNTRISSYRECPRAFFFRHIKMWSPDGTAIALVNGLAWHDAMDIVWKGISEGKMSQDEVYKTALAAYVTSWIEGGYPAPEHMSMEDIERFYPRGPAVAAEVLMNYILQRSAFIKDGELIDVEKPFAVPLYDHTNKVIYIGRLDKVFNSRPDGLRVIEHKSTSMYGIKTGFQPRYIDSFSPNSQVDGYTHAAHMLYDSLRGIYVDVALFHKKVHDKFKFIPIDRSVELLEGWLHDTRNWVERIEADKAAYKEGGLLASFPKNTSACGNWSGCVYLDICRYKADPDIDEVPPGFVRNEWNPFDVNKIEKLGLLPEEKKS